jgi:8-oxo-dGTP diphosphatase
LVQGKADMHRRYGDAPLAGVRYTRRVGAYAILPRDGALLLTHQEEPGPEVQLPGGGIDPGESPIQALHREVFEETGWRIARPRRLGAFRRFTYMPEYDLWAEKLCLIYVATRCDSSARRPSRGIARYGPRRVWRHRWWAIPAIAPLSGTGFPGFDIDESCGNIILERAGTMKLFHHGDKSLQAVGPGKPPQDWTAPRSAPLRQGNRHCHPRIRSCPSE